jgi:tetratricopeptide (TPR) repeat protein
MMLTVSRGAWLALSLTLAVWPLLDPDKPWRRRLAYAGGALAAALFAFGSLYAVSSEVRDRLTALVRDGGERTRPAMWSGAWRLFLDAPALGTGAGSYNVLFERHRPAGYRDEPQWAHNDYLNTLSDHGVAGFALAFILPAWALLRARSARGGRSAANAGERAWAAGLLGFGMTLALDFHLKLPALAMAAAMAFALWCGRWAVGPSRRSDRSVTPGRRAVALGSALGVLGAMTFLVSPTLRAEAWRYGARRSIDAWAEGRGGVVDQAALLASARMRLAKAVVIDDDNAQAWADLSYVLSLLARDEPGSTLRLGVEAEAAARQALARAEPVPEFWWRLGVALDMQGRWSEAGAAFVRALELAPHHPLAWYHQAYHYSLNPATRALARPSLATCLRLDPGYAPAESLWESLMAGP